MAVARAGGARLGPMPPSPHVAGDTLTRPGQERMVLVAVQPRPLVLPEGVLDREGAARTARGRPRSSWSGYTAPATRPCRAARARLEPGALVPRPPITAGHGPRRLIAAGLEGLLPATGALAREFVRGLRPAVPSRVDDMLGCPGGGGRWPQPLGWARQRFTFCFAFCRSSLSLAAGARPGPVLTETSKTTEGGTSP